MTSLARRERHELCDLMLEVGPDAPTLCEGWDVRDLAAHLWVREHEFWAASGMVIPFMAPILESRMRRAAARPFPELVASVRRGVGGLNPYRIDAVDRLVNTAEMFIHHEDVRRALASDVAPRQLSDADQNELWGTLGPLSFMALRSTPVGVSARRPDGEHRRLHAGNPMVTLEGEPGELLLAISGRRDHAEVTLHGDEEAVAEFLGSKGGL